MILIFSGVLGDTRRYRTFHAYQQLQIAGVECRLSHLTDPNLPRYFDLASIIVLHRVPLDRYTAKLIQNARNRGALIITDVDDLTFDPQAFRWINSPDFSDPVRRRIYQADMARQRSTLLDSHAVITSTHFLAEQVRVLGKPAWIHRNGFSLEMLHQSLSPIVPSALKTDRVVIGYASGTPTHDRDFNLVRSALIQVMKDNPNTELWMVGPVNPGEGFDPFGQRVRRLPLVPWRDLPGLLRQFDINLAPLQTDNPFSQSKSEIKYMEAALVGVPTIASPTDAFGHAIKHQTNGFLAGSSNEWLDSLNFLVESSDARREVGEAAREEVLKCYHPTIRANELINLLLEINEQVQPGKQREIKAMLSLPRVETPEDESSYMLPVGIEKRPTYVERGLYSLQHRGIGILLGEVWVFLRRLLAPIFPFRVKNAND